LLCQSLFAQNDSIMELLEVVVSDTQLRQFSTTQSVLKLNDSVIKKNRPPLTELLNYNSVIYFKENGFGMVSSPSFRGTTAQQTAVIWNGLNINSQFNGLTDFNTITTRDFNSIAVRAGGGSVIYGSSAIGGSIHLNSDLEFRNQFTNELQLNYGSFNTFSGNYNLNASTENLASQIRISRNSSDNDFDFPDDIRKNINGEYENTSFNVSFGYKINPSNYLKLYSYLFDGERHFALISPSETKTKYLDFNTRNLLEWQYVSKRFSSKIKAAFLTEEYTYVENLETGSSFYGKAETIIAKYDAAYKVFAGMLLNAVADFTQTKGTGSDVGDNKRQIGAFSLLLKQEVRKKFKYEIGVRKEATNNYDSPVLFSAGMAAKFGQHYTLKWNGSRNFRIPTFNDLYWLEGGNPDLKPESSIQTELGNEFNFKNLNFSVTGYLINIDDMIQWLPGTSTVWFPRNIYKVRTYGVETLAGWKKKIGRNEIALNGTYAYTVSENRQTGYQLIYVPYHKATGAIAFSRGKFSADYQILFNGEVFTRSDNNPVYNIESYMVSNIRTGYRFGKRSKCEVGIGVHNLFDESYQVMEGRPFPGRNYQMYLTFNF
jgi:outer membrane cobalamin receptor